MGTSVEDLTGQRFGHLTVLRRDGSSPRNRALWLCQCDCGKTRIADTSHLRNMEIVRCKDCARKYFTQAIQKDLTGKRLGHLTVIEPSDEKINGHRSWVCRCDCGAIVIRPSTYLTSGKDHYCPDCLKKFRQQNVAKMNEAMRTIVHTDCKFNPETECRALDPDCSVCGWNPSVQRERRKRLQYGKANS